MYIFSSISKSYLNRRCFTITYELTLRCLYAGYLEAKARPETA